MTQPAQLLGVSRGIVAVREKVHQLLQQAAAHRLPPILLCGETGTGKGLLARIIHGAGPRRDGPFVDVNCAAIPETLLEAELFGFERGAFTDARRAKPGLFQTAHRGTIFLDEVGLLPETLQGKLLKVIDERAVRRLGSTQSEPVDISILTATNEDLLAAVRTRRFRQDLYHRLAVLTVELPPLRERRDDIVLLAENFLARTCTEYGLEGKALAAEAKAALYGYQWPGNVRELANVIERATLLAEAPILTATMLQLGEVAARRVPRAGVAQSDVFVRRSVADLEGRLILQALTETDWNITKTAAQLGISRNTLKVRIKKYGLQPGRASPAEAAAPDPVPLPPSPAPVPTARVGVQWESHRLAVLRVVLPIAEGEQPAADSSRALDMLIQKVEAFGGRLVEIGATAIVAAFGLDPVEDAPRRAALVAMAMQKAALRERGGEGERPSMRAAIHAVQVPVARVGAAADIDGDAKRHVWSVLDTLIAGAEPGAIVVSQRAMSLLARRFVLAGTGASETASGPVYRLTDYRPTPFDLGGHMGRFVGREHELDLLISRFEAVHQGQGQLVAIVGEAGIGKSRLLFEFRQSLGDQRVTYLQGHCFSYGSAIPYLPILEVVRTICRIAESDTPEAVADKCRMCLEDVGMDPAQSAPYLLHLLGMKDGTGLVATLTPEVIKIRTFETLHGLFLKSSQREPLIVAIEDLHWVDQTSEEYLASLAERVVGRRIFLVATYRPGYRSPWSEKSFATQIALQPLAPHDSLTVVRVVFGAHDVAAPLAHLILAKAEGNPFFLEELARAAREQGPASTALIAPDTVQEVLLARIDRLPFGERRLLQAAAVIGKDFASAILRAIADGSDETVRDGLRRLQTAEFIYETSPIPQPEYTFKHALTHEVAYESLPFEQRRTLHARILSAIETIYADRLSEHVDRLAHHAFLGQVWDKALVHMRQAGAKAVARSAHSEAVTCFARALEALGHLPEARERTEQAVDLHMLLANSLLPIAELAQILDHLGEAERLARALGDQTRLGRVSSFLTVHFWLIGDPERAVEHGRRAFDIAKGLDDLGLRVRTNHALGQAYHVLGDYKHAIEALRRNVDELQGDRLGRRFGMVGLASVLSRTWLVWCLAELGEFADALPRGEEAIRIAETVDHPYSLLAAYFGVGGLHLRRGEIGRAAAFLERALDLCRVWDTQLRLWFLGVAPSVGHAYALSGRAAQAIPLLEQAVERAAATNMMFAHSLRVAWLAHAYLLADRVPEARRLGSEALALARRHRERGHEAWIHWIVGEIAANAGPADVVAAEHAYREAIAIADELGMRPRVALGHLGLGRLYRRAGRGASAEEHLGVATELLRAMQMPLWLEEAQAELSALSGRPGKSHD